MHIWRVRTDRHLPFHLNSNETRERRRDEVSFVGRFVRAHRCRPSYASELENVPQKIHYIKKDEKGRKRVSFEIKDGRGDGEGRECARAHLERSLIEDVLKRGREHILLGFHQLRRDCRLGHRVLGNWKVEGGRKRGEGEMMDV